MTTRAPYQPRACARLLLQSGFLLVLLGAAPLLGDPPSLYEVTRASEDIYLSLQAGRISYRIRRIDTAGNALEHAIEEEHKRMLVVIERRAELMRGQPERAMKAFEARQARRRTMVRPSGTVMYFRRFRDDDVELRFDRNKHLCWRRQTSRHDWKTLIDQHSLGEYGEMNLQLMVQCARAKDAFVKYTAYLSHQKVICIMARGARINGEDLLKAGLLLQERVITLDEYKHQIEAVDKGFALTFSKGGSKPRLVFVLDPALGLRITEERTLWYGGVSRLRKLSYREFDGVVFLSGYTTTNYDSEGAVVDQEIYEVTSAEFSESLDSGEFLMELPPGGVVLDRQAHPVARLPDSELPGTGGLRIGVEDVVQLVLEEAVQRERQRQMETGTDAQDKRQK